MGVLACNRNGCENIMCDYYSHEHGYLCRECMTELEYKPFEDIRSFMRSYKTPEAWVNDTWKEHLKSEFKNRYEED